MVFRQKVNARNAAQRLRKFHRAPAASSTLDSLSHQVKPNTTSQRTRSPSLPQASVIQPSRPGSQWDEREEQILLSMHREGKNCNKMGDQLPGRSHRARQLKLWKMKVQGPDPSLVNSNEWQPYEDQTVISNREAGKTWEEIGILLSRTAGAVAKRWKKHLKDDRRRRLNTHKGRQRIRWSPREEKLLLSLRAGRKAWDAISKKLPGRSIEACQKHYGYMCQRDGIQEPGTGWTQSEVEDLVSRVKRIGPLWSNIAKNFPGRSREACKCRYYKPYSVEQRGIPWTESEEETLLSLLIGFGRIWQRISKEIPTRSLDACRTKHYAYLEQHDGKLPTACGPSAEEWRQKWGKESLVYRLQNELSRTTLTNIDDLAAEEAEHLTQVDHTTQATNEAVNSDAMEFSYPVLNTVPTLKRSRKPSNVDARKRRVMDVPEV